MRLINPKFILSAFEAAQFPDLQLPEIAFLGRSNVGKSSLLNHLFQTKGLAKTSATPGKTQCINFFVADRHLAFADLPGYGYAKVSQEQKQKWGNLIETYLNERSALKLLLLLVDSRHDLTAEDERMLEWIHYHKREAIVVLTKVDKLPFSSRLSHTRKVLDRIKGLPYVHYSTTEKEGRAHLLALINKTLFNTSTSCHC